MIFTFRVGGGEAGEGGLFPGWSSNHQFCKNGYERVVLLLKPRLSNKTQQT